MYKKVLVGYDGHSQSDDAISLANQLVDPNGGELTLVCSYPHVIYAGGFYPGPVADDSDHEKQRAQRVLEQGQKRARSDVKVVLKTVASASSTQGISVVAEAGGYDLLVLGSTHHGPVGRVFLGSTGERLLHSSPCAVAVAPRNFHPSGESFKHIGVAFNGSPESVDAMNAAYELAGDTGAEVTLYTVASTGFSVSMVGTEYAYAAHQELAHENALKLLSEAGSKAPAGVTISEIVLEGDPARSISQAGAGTIDLLVVGSRGYGAVKRALLGSTSAELMRDAPFPVVIIPRESEQLEQESERAQHAGQVPRPGERDA